MNYLTRVFGGIKDGFRSIGFMLVSALLPMHGKRLIFITSLYCYVARLDELQDEALNRLNQAMYLAKNGHALRFPAAVSGVVWNGIGIQSVLSMDVLNNDASPLKTLEIAERVVALSPSWLRYSSRNKMVRDVRALINNTTGLAQAA
jgi:hypothetical protein